MKKVACLYANGSEELELISVVDVLKRAGVQADLISISGEQPVSAHNIVIKADFLLENVKISQYDAIYIPGGSKGSQNLASNQEVLKAIQGFHSQGKPVAAICAGPTVLEAAGILDGHVGTSYPGFEKELSFQEYREEPVVTSQGIITSRGPATALLLGFEILIYLGLKDVAEKIQKDMLMDELGKVFRK